MDGCGRKITDKNACMRWALTVASGFPLTSTVNVSSFSVVIKLPNQERFVSSGDESGVKCTSSEETKSYTNYNWSFENWLKANWLMVDIVPCNFRLWKRGLPKKLFLIFVSRVFHIWPPALLHVDPVMTAGGVGTLLPTPGCGEPGIGAITADWCKKKTKNFNSNSADNSIRCAIRTITIFSLWEQTDCYCWTGIGTVMGRRCLLLKVDDIIVRRLCLWWLRLLRMKRNANETIGWKDVKWRKTKRIELENRLPVVIAGPLDSRQMMCATNGVMQLQPVTMAVIILKIKNWIENLIRSVWFGTAACMRVHASCGYCGQIVSVFISIWNWNSIYPDAMSYVLTLINCSCTMHAPKLLARTFEIGNGHTAQGTFYGFL